MKQTLIRLILFVLFALLLFYVFHRSNWVLEAFVITYIFEPLVSEISNK